MTRGAVRIDAYVEAVRERDALKRAVEDEPGAEHLVRAYDQAKARVVERYRLLTGGQVGAARRRLAELVTSA